MIEASHKKLEHAPPGADAAGCCRGRPAGHPGHLLLADHHRRLLPAGLHAHRAGGPVFKPLAYTKTFVMLAAALVSITFARRCATRSCAGRSAPRRPPGQQVHHPALQALRVRGPAQPQVHGAHRPAGDPLRRPHRAEAGHEFMPPLNEGDVLYMPTTFPNLSIEEAKRSCRRRTGAARAARGGLGLRQGRPRRDRDRPRPADDGGGPRWPQARGAVAQARPRPLVLDLAPELARPCCASSGPSRRRSPGTS
jgi:Cu(I)/Ag(I) efflux system membrane protein CusA/SilA